MNDEDLLYKVPEEEIEKVVPVDEVFEEFISELYVLHSANRDTEFTELVPAKLASEPQFAEARDSCGHTLL